MLRIGYIGLGLMGKSMARNILKGGYPLIIHNRSRAAVEELCAEGAQPAFNPQEVAAQVDVVFTNLPDSIDLEEVALGLKGIAAGAHAGLIHVDHSTIKPAVARRVATELARYGVSSLDAPVSGGDIGARDGTLSIMVGGEEEVLEKVMPVLNCEGKTITYIGKSAPVRLPKLPIRLWWLPKWWLWVN